jgi:superfamily I DNA/RNA helicase
MTIRLAPPAAVSPPPPLDGRQESAVSAIVSGGQNVLVVGEAGSGKTRVAVEAAARAVHGGLDASAVVVLAPTRPAAARLRDAVGLAMAQPVGAPVARTPASLAHAILRAVAAAEGAPDPILVTGAEQDVMLREILEGHASGRVAPLDWGPGLPQESTSLPGFRAELRDLLMRAEEAGVTPDDLASLADRVDRPEWRAAAVVLREYTDITALRSTPADQGERFDVASVIPEAAAALREWRGPGKPTWRLVIVDDAQDLTLGGHQLLAALASDGSRIALIGNADASVEGYRGAVPAALAATTADKGPFALGATLMELGHGKRQPVQLAGVSRAFAQRIGTLGVGSARLPAPGGVDAATATGQGLANGQDGAPPATVLTAPHRHAQSRAIAHHIRRARHGLDGEAIPWGRMCVVARSTARLREVRADLAAADIPCEPLGESVALHAEPAVSPLLRIVRAAAGEPWTEADAVEFLSSRAVGLDAVALRRLRRELVREEREGGGTRGSGVLLVEAIAADARWSTVRGPEARAAATASRAVVAAAARMAQPGATPGAVLWTAWKELDVASSWRAAALAGSARDDADLDAVVALMRAAQTYAERLPESGVLEFVEYLESQDFAADSLGARASLGDVVTFCTPAAAAGREWDLVVVAGVEEGAWPNLRLRDSVLGAQHFAEIVAGRAEPKALEEARIAYAGESRRHVLDDETRAMLVAVSRARRRLVVTAVAGEDSRPSRFLHVVADAAGCDIEDAAQQREGHAAVADLRSAVSAVRRAAAGAPAPEREGYSRLLAALAAADVPGAHPRDWHGVPEPSTTQGFWDDDDPVRVSPSRVEWVETCALRWALESTGAVRESSQAQDVGTLIHELAEAHPDGDAQALLTDFDRLWRERYSVSTWPEHAAYASARDKVERLAAYLSARPAAEVRTEQGFRVEIDRAVLAGKADRVEVTADGAYVIDIKTGAAMPSVEEALANPQLAMYQLAVEHGGIEGASVSLGAELAFVSSGVAGTARKQGPIDVPEARARLTAVVETMSGRTFLAQLNPRCDGCPVRRSCPVHAQGAQVTDL